jgi:hypothetical protein
MPPERLDGTHHRFEPAVCWTCWPVRREASGMMSGMAEYETWLLELPRGWSRNQVRQLLTEHAEYGRWELWRLRLLPDGRRRVWLRRRVVRGLALRRDVIQPWAR